MRRPSRNLLDNSADRTPQTAHRGWFRLCAVCCVLSAALTGCESLQRKLIRKPKNRPKPTPIVTFTDYTRTMTPLDRYRKHAVIFEYWNGELVKALEDTVPNQPVNQKRL